MRGIERERGGNGDATTEKSECDMKYLQGLQRRMSRNRSAQDGSLLLAHAHTPTHTPHMQTPTLPTQSSTTTNWYANKSSVISQGVGAKTQPRYHLVKYGWI